MALEQVAPDFAHTTFSVRILKVGCESLALQPSCGEGVLRSRPRGPQPHIGPVAWRALTVTGCTRNCHRTQSAARQR